MKPALLLIILLSISSCLFAQDFPFGAISSAEVNMTKYAKDTTAHAVVLKEFGKTWLSSAAETPLVHEYHSRIKIFDSEAFNQGTIEIPIYKIDADRFETVSDIKGVIFFKDENGNVQKSELDTKKVFHVKENKYWDVVKFTFPNLHKGCVIEYSYKLETPRIWTFKNWTFQSAIPKIYSEYEAHIPAVFNYNVSLRGPYKLTKNNAELEKDCFSPGGGVGCDCSKITYMIADVPTFIPEEYMTSPKNFMSALYFELSDYTNLNTGNKIKVAKEWKDVDYDMKKDDGFGGQLKRTGIFKDKLASLTGGKTDPLEKAKTVFQNIKKNFKWNGFIGWRSDDGIKKAFDSHSGAVGDINLTLITALNAAGINTEAVLLSTRDYGVVNKLYPVESDFNYVVAKANIDGKSYLLDATDPLLPFGLLPLDCINDQGRVMSLDKPSYWIDLIASQKKTRTYAFDLTLQSNGKLKGTMLNYSSGYEALDKRISIKKFNTTEEYIDDLDNKLKNIKILKSEIKNLDSLDAPLTEQYEIEMDAFPDLTAARYAFNPFFIDLVRENPFKLPERTYPVDRGAMFDDKFVLTLHLPSQISVETVPENVALALPLNGGRFLVSYTKTVDGLSFSHTTQFNRSIYSPDEYPYLKELFSKIIQAQHGEIVFKKN